MVRGSARPGDSIGTRRLRFLRRGLFALLFAYCAISLPGVWRDLTRLRVADRIVVFESDDWGPHSRPRDLRRLAGTLAAHRDRFGRSPIFTLNLVLAEPAFSRIESSGFGEYHWRSIDETAPEVCSTIREQAAAGLLLPQVHAREHVNARRWLDLLRRGEPDVTAAFLDERMYLAGGTETAGGSRAETYLARSMESPFIAHHADAGDLGLEEYVAEHIAESQRIFERVFGFPSQSWIAPFWCWNRTAETEWAKHGLRYLQGGENLTASVDREGTPTIHRYYFGERSPAGLIYLERNVYFEPLLGRESHLADDAFEKVRYAWDRALPAVICTHADKYSAEAQGAFGTSELDRLLARLAPEGPVYLHSVELGELAERGSLEVTDSTGARVGMVTTSIPPLRRLELTVLESTKASAGLSLLLILGAMELAAWARRRR